MLCILAPRQHEGPLCCIQVVDLDEVLNGGVELHWFAGPSVIEDDPDDVGRHCKQ